MKDRIHVCYALYDKSGHFSKFVGTSIQSLLHNTNSDVDVHLVYFGHLDESVKERFRCLVNNHRQRLFLYDATNFYDDVIGMIHNIWLDIFSPAALYRLFIWDILPDTVKRIIWLDADTIVNMDIAELWAEPVGKNGFAGVVDNIVRELPGKESVLQSVEGFDTKKYINAGVVMMERALFCVPDWKDKVAAFFRKFPNAWYCEQDVLNYYYGQECNLLAEKFNTLVGWQQVKNIYKEEACIYHYSGTALDFDFSSVYTALFFRYFVETPWCDVAFLRRMWSVVESVHDMRTTMMRDRFSAMGGKRRVAVTSKEDADKLFGIDSLGLASVCPVFVPGVKEQSIDIDALYAGNDESIVLLFSGSYMDLRDQFKEKGYVDGVDFINGGELLTIAEGGIPLDGNAIFSQL